MICDVLKQALYFVGRMLAALVTVAGVIGVGIAALTSDDPSVLGHQFLAGFAVFLLAVWTGVVVHELGHLTACLALGAEVKAFRLGGTRAAVRFPAARVQVSIGLPYRGRVEYEGACSVWRRAVITLAGSLAGLALAGLVLAVAAAVVTVRGTPPVVWTAADGLALVGLTSLMPYQARSGELSDGARLLELRSDVAAQRLRVLAQAADRLRREGRTAELVELHAGLEATDGRLSLAQAIYVSAVEINVAVVPGRLPDDTVRLAERRVSALVRQRDLGRVAPMAYLTLALLRLRKGDQDGPAEAERLCEQAVAGRYLTDNLRRIALAAVIVSRQARGLPHEDVQAAAALVAGHHSTEATAAMLSAAFDPEAALRAFRHGDPGARLGAGAIAEMLRRQGMSRELLELHAGFGTPSGPHAQDQAHSLHDVEYNVLLLPDLPPEVLDVAASRLEWIAASYPHDRKKEPAHHAAFQHSLAVARLRQGRFAEVEPLCAPRLARNAGKEARATVLATVALARRALGQPYASLLAEAIALSPDADLVAEAQGSQLSWESQPQPFGMS
jgi:hypothetical protein